MKRLKCRGRGPTADDQASAPSPFGTPMAGLYNKQMAQIYAEDRGQNYAVRSGTRAAEALAEPG